MTADSTRFSAVALADDDLFLEHVAPPEHPERGARLLAVREGLSQAVLGLGVGHEYTRLAPTDATEEQLMRVHAPSYLAQLGQLAGKSGLLDADTYISPGSVAAAWRAAGATVALVNALHEGATRFGLALPRPPGHHALADQAMGFCLLNNVAVAAAHARARGHERVLILDWDVHHGNGTEAIFYSDPNVLFISLHQYPNYPGTGAASDVGVRDGRGRTVNVPLPPGSGDSVYAAAFERIVLPIVEGFRPDFALVSCGFDAHERDPLAQMNLTAAGFGAMTSSLMATLDTTCPLGIVLEGGYDLQALTESSRAVATALLRGGAPPPPHTPIGSEPSEALRAVARQMAPFWHLP